MTLILALKCAGTEEGKEGVLICADSKVTTDIGIAVRVEKIFPIKTKNDQHVAIAAGAGDEAMVKHAIRVAEKELNEMAEREWKNGYPSFEQFEEAIEAIERKMITKLTEWREERLKPDLSIILCGVDPKGKASIYMFDERGLSTPAHDVGFACIGRGFVTGGNVILQQFWKPNQSANEALTLAAYTVEMLSKVDTTVGSFEGSSWFFRIIKGKPTFGPLKTDSITTCVQNIRRREDVLRLSWNLCDQVGETVP